MNAIVVKRAEEGNKGKGSSVLLPSSLNRSPILINVRLDEINLFEKSLSDVQKNAVTAILRAQCRPNCHLVIGPERSGKSAVLVETALQVMKEEPEMKTLIVCKSKSAARSLVNRFLNPNIVKWETDLGAGSIRINVPVRHFATHQYVSGVRSKEASQKPCNKLLSNYLDLKQEFIILKTVIIENEKSLMANLRSSQMMFDYVLVDDADVMTQSEILAAKSLAKSGESLCVLCGKLANSDSTLAQLICSKLYLSKYLKDSAFTSALCQVSITSTGTDTASSYKVTGKDLKRQAPSLSAKKVRARKKQEELDVSTGLFPSNGFDHKLKEIFSENTAKLAEKCADQALERAKFLMEFSRFVKRYIELDK